MHQFRFPNSTLPFCGAGQQKALTVFYDFHVPSEFSPIRRFVPPPPETSRRVSDAPNPVSVSTGGKKPGKMSNFRGFLKIKLSVFLLSLLCLPSFQCRNLPFGDPRLYLRQVKPDQPPNLDEGDFPVRHIFPQGRLFYGGPPFQFRYINQMFHRSLRGLHSAGHDEPTIADMYREQNV
jgi:hypothetical protein